MGTTEMAACTCYLGHPDDPNTDEEACAACDAEFWNDPVFILAEDESFCGCCGNECPETDLWCERCAEHVIDARHPWEATYFAVHGTDCPHAVTCRPEEALK